MARNIQIQQHGCRRFQAVPAKAGTKKDLWAAMLVMLRNAVLDGRETLRRLIAKKDVGPRIENLPGTGRAGRRRIGDERRASGRTISGHVRHSSPSTQDLMDPLSEIVSLLHPHDCVAAGFDAAGDWSIRFDPHAGMKCNAVIRGRCWLAVDGAEAVRLEAGDCAILPRGRTFLLSARPVRSGRDAQTLYAPVRHGGTALYNGGGEFFMTGARFLLSGPAADVLTGTLPPLIVLRGGGAQNDGIRWALDRLAAELREPRLGGALSIEHLSHFLLLQVMREHLAGAPPETVGWLAALSDPPVARAVAALHADPARAWTLQDLASEAHLSRTAFALRFRRVAGQTPMEYLAQWRMLSAAEKLRAGRSPVARIATEAGYASESAFAAAFKRVMGRSPRRHARDANAAE